VDFCNGSQNDFQGGIKVVKFHLTHSKLRKQPFLAKTLIEKCQVTFKVQGGNAPDPSSDAHDEGFYGRRHTLFSQSQKRLILIIDRPASPFLSNIMLPL